MKVLQINSVCGVGSTGRIATDLYKILEKQEHECLIAYGRENSPENINVIKIGSKFDNYMHVLKTRIFDKHGYGSIRATEQLIKKIKVYNPDIIHLHNIHGYFLNIEVLFKYLKTFNKPIIWTLHDCWAFTGHCAYFDYSGCTKWVEGCNKCIQMRNYPKSILMDNSYKNYENKKKIFSGLNNLTIVIPSKWLANIVKESFLSEYNTYIIRNGIDLKVFNYNSKTNIKSKLNIDDKIMILAVANIWDERKGLSEYIKLSKMLSEDYKIVLVGLSSNQIKELPSNMIGLQKTKNIQELVDIYSGADLFVNLTLEDNYPTVNLEAQACGLDVITYNTGGSPETLYSSNSKVVEKGNLNDVVYAIINSGLEKNKINLDSIDKYKTLNDYVKLYENQIILNEDRK